MGRAESLSPCASDSTMPAAALTWVRASQTSPGVAVPLGEPGSLDEDSLDGDSLDGDSSLALESPESEHAASSRTPVPLSAARRNPRRVKPDREPTKSCASSLALIALVSCGDGGGGAATDANEAAAQAAAASKLFPDNFKGVCSGASVSNATAYDPNAAAHKALYFTTYEDDLTDRSSSLPGDWTVQWSRRPGEALRMPTSSHW